MKKYLTTIIAVGILAIAIVALVVVQGIVNKNKPADEPPEPDSTYEKLLDFDEGEISKIETFYTENYVLEKKDKKWVLTSHTFDTYASSVTSTANSIAEIGGYRIDNVENMSEYGFGEDLSKNPHVVITKNDGAKFTLYIGDLDHSQYYRYVYSDSSKNTVYKVSSFNAKDLMVTKEKLVRLIAFAYAYNDEPIYFLVKKDGEKVLELNFKESVVDEQQGTMWTWRVKYPVDRDCENTEANNIIKAMRNLDLGGISKEAVPESELANYGLSPASIEYYLYMQSTDGEKTLYRIRVGNKIEDGNYYYCTIHDASDGKVDIYTVAVDNVYRNVNPLDYIDTFLFLKDSDLLEKVNFTIAGETHELKYTYEKKDEETITTRFFDGRECVDDDTYSIVATDSMLTIPTEEQLARNKDLDITNDITTVNPYDAFNRVLTALYSNMSLSEIIAEEPAERGEKIAEIQYTELDGTVTKVTLYKRDNTTAWAYINDNYAGGYCRTTALFGDDYMGFDFAISLKGLKTVMALVP